MTLHGDSATVVPFEKRSVFRVCFNINRILFACYNCVAQHFGTYGVFRTEKTPSICIFPSLTFFCSKKSSWTGIWAVWGFQFRKMTLHGDSATVVPSEKRSVFRVCFNINRILYACYNCVAQHFGTYGVFGTEKTPS